MQTIYAGNMKKSAFIKSQLEACKIGQKVKKIFLKKLFSTSMAGCKRCALKGGGGGGEGKGKKKRKEKEKGGKNGDQNHFF